MRIDELTMQLNEPSTYLKNLYHFIDYHPLTVGSDSYVMDAISLMNQKRPKTVPSTSLNSSANYTNSDLQETSYVLVIESGHLLGIFTERDLVRLAASKIDFADLKITEVMTQPVITLKISHFQDIFTILSLFHQHQIRHLPILNDSEQLIGIVTMTSLLPALNPMETLCSLQALIQQSCSLSAWCDEAIPTIQDQQTEVTLYSGMAEDITDRQQSELAVKDSEEFYRFVVTAMSEGIILQQADGKIITCNASAERILGLSREQIIERTIDDQRWLAIREDGSPFPSEEYPAMVTLRTGQPCANVILGIYKPNGQLAWISLNTQPLHRENETVPYAVVTSFADISERQAALQERQQAEQKIREQAALLEIATDAIYVRDLHSEILFWNQGAERLYGWSKQEAIGRNAQELLYTETLVHLNEQAFNVVTQIGVWQGELQKVTKYGQEIIVESRWTLMRDAAGEAKSILIVDTDITQKKQLEEQFFRAQRLESLGTLAGGIAHDLNNILTPILAAAQILKIKLPNEQERSPTVEGASSQYLLEILENNAKRGAGLVKQVLSFARGFKGERITVQLKHLITDIILIGKQTFPKSIEFISSFPEELWAVCGDVTQLHQVLMNLVVNARDAMPDGGTINITAENIFIDETYSSMVLEAKVGNYIKVTVADTGVGMSAEILDRIFEPFFTTKDIGAGTGLGLSTVLGIIKSHGGFVTVSSKVGQGSKFKLFLPAIPAIPDLPTQEIETPPGNGELILIVDDEAPIREIAKMILEDHNYNTLIAANGIEAIALYAQNKHRINVVLMDMMMPEMDGVTAIRTLRKMNSHVRIIATSGINVTETLAQAAIVGVQQVLSKPFTAQELLNTLHHVLQG
ncbi:PAS domain S-box protein [Anabaena azotica]|uniref:histidine kinase n=1 Tax=Anabaena azotica FACHB-119 TaxID=947527 RepID=A0ABR8D5M5_9NOST|nr:PAS domain S-box protein [Anabaena azotica]MBD2502212.1 PAS domain S-box protein [Anabaena azotica FACHB-119]